MLHIAVIQPLLVTGAASGIGREITLQALSAGCQVHAWDVNAAGLARLAEDSPAAAAGKLSTERVDVADRADVERAMAAAAAGPGAPRALVNCAGLPSGSQVGFADGVLGVIGTVQLVTETWLAQECSQDGAVVSVASIAGNFAGGSGPAWYSAGKAAVAGYTRHLATHRPRGVRANAVAPGLVDTPRTQALLHSDKGAALVSANPLGRVATPADIAGVVLFLASAAAGYVNGAVIPIEGGLTLV
jgi:NAD(P)-dependent dehydrogenase (short-subunit alcohol dehydrogenase family)